MDTGKEQRVYMRVMRSATLADPSRRALALLGITIVLLIVGLLGMHALNGESNHAAVDDQTVAAASSTQTAAHGPGQSDGPAHCVDRCAAPAPGQAPGHDSVAACVLALLAGLILLARPNVALPIVLRTTSLRSLAARLGSLVPRPGPDLSVLSISRT